MGPNSLFGLVSCNGNTVHEILVRFYHLCYAEACLVHCFPEFLSAHSKGTLLTIISHHRLILSLSLSVLTLTIELVGLFAGISIFFPKINALEIAGHFLAILTLTFFTFNNWNFFTYWYIFFLFNVPLLVVEVCMFFYVVVLKVVPY